MYVSVLEVQLIAGCLVAIFRNMRPHHNGCLYSVDWNGPLDYWNGLLEHWNGILEWITGMATYLTRCSLGGKAGLGPDSNYSNVYFITAMYLAFRLTAHTLNR